MPSMRPASLGRPHPASAPAPARPAQASVAAPAAVGAAIDDGPKPGGFHESSYELQHGLQITESEWPDDVTVPGALGER